MRLPNKIILGIILPILVFSVLFHPSTALTRQSVPGESINASNPTTPTQLGLDQVDTSGLVKVLNYNIEVSGRNPNWKEVIKHENPDIILLVEMGSFELDGLMNDLVAELSSYFPDEPSYKYATFDSVGSTDGQAVLSRFPIVNIDVADDDNLKLDDGSPYNINHPVIDATVDINGLDVHFLVNHLTCCGDGLGPRILEQEALMNYFDELGDVPIVYGGDFNSESPLDTGNIKPNLFDTLGTEPIEIMVNSSHPYASKVHTWTDSFRALNPYRKGTSQNYEGTYTSIDHYRTRYDYIFVNQHLVDALVNSSVVDPYPAAISSSDHHPMYTFFNFNHDQVDLQPPKPVGNVTIDVSATSTSLAWNPSLAEDLYKYSIYRNGCLIVDVQPDQTTFVDDHSYDSTATYFYEVVAVDEHGNKARPSLPVFSRPSYGQLTVPTAPVLTTTRTADGNLLNWTIPDDGGLPVLEVNLYKWVGAGDFILATELTNSDSYLFKISRSGIPFKFVMLAKNLIGESALSNEISDTSVLAQNIETHQDSEKYSVYTIHDILTKDYACPTVASSIPLPITTSTTSTSETPGSSTSSANFGLLFLTTLMIIPVLRRKNRF